MAQYTFRDIEEFLLDDDFFQWARYMGHRTKRILRIERKEYQTY
jgi:hypothetical protein